MCLWCKAHKALRTPNYAKHNKLWAPVVMNMGWGWRLVIMYTQRGWATGVMTMKTLDRNYKVHEKVIVSFRSPSLFYLLVHSRCRGFLFSLDHTQTHIKAGRTPMEEGSARRRDLYLTTQTLYKRKKNPCPRSDSNPRSQQALGRRPTP
jgi:hypothetical protein